jgi:hypothetical protein
LAYPAKKQGQPGFAAKALVRSIPAFQIFKKLLGFAFLEQKWSTVYMMNAMFIVIGRFELFGAFNAGFAIGLGALSSSLPVAFSGEKRCDGIRNFSRPGLG